MSRFAPTINHAHCRMISMWAMGLALVTSIGCASIKESDTARTGLEQLLISSAVDRSLNKVDFRPISGAKVFIKPELLDCVDKNYVLLSLKARLLKNDNVLVDKAEDADVILEIASGGVGTDRTDLFLGTPDINLGMMGAVPKTSFYERKRAMGTAKLILVATDNKSKQPVINEGFALARSDHQHWSMLGVGPVTSGQVVKELETSTGESETIMSGESLRPFNNIARRGNAEEKTR
jgi:hypothetical protein